MGVSFGLKITTGIIAAVLVIAAAAQASRVFAPLAAALFIIAIVWPVQKRLQSWMPKLAALAITIIVTVAVCLGFASLAAWGFGRVGRSLVADLPRYQALYAAAVTWLDGHGVSVAGLWAEHFNVGWLLRATQYVTGRVNTTLTFWVIALVYVMLGLLEVDNVRQKIERLDNRAAARVLLDGSAATAAKFRRYLLVRTKMSAVTGVLVGAFAGDYRAAIRVRVGRDRLRAQLYPVHRSVRRDAVSDPAGDDAIESWQAVLGVFVCLNIIQFAVGSYIEPRVAGTMLSISPVVVLFAIFSGRSCGACSGPSLACRSRSPYLPFAPRIHQADGSPICFGGPEPAKPGKL